MITLPEFERQLNLLINETIERELNPHKEMNNINFFQTEDVEGREPILFTKQDMMEQARIEGRIFVTRFDRDLCELVTDLITPDMPEEEILI